MTLHPYTKEVQVCKISELQSLQSTKTRKKQYDASLFDANFAVCGEASIVSRPSAFVCYLLSYICQHVVTWILQFGISSLNNHFICLCHMLKVESYPEVLFKALTLLVIKLYTSICTYAPLP